MLRVTNRTCAVTKRPQFRSSSHKPHVHDPVNRMRGDLELFCTRMSVDQQGSGLLLKDATRIPPLPFQVGPRVEHIIVEDTGRISDVLYTQLGVSLDVAERLLLFGAIYSSRVVPHAPDQLRKANAAMHRKVMEAHAAGISLLGRSRNLQQPARVLANCEVQKGSYIRAHLHPKRFPAAYSVDWAARIVANTELYVVVNKPSGVQVPPTVDNILESTCACTGKALGLPWDSLLNTHRLDAGTEGLVVLAKTRKAAAAFSQLLQHEPPLLRKVYRALTARPPPRGTLLHWLAVGRRGSGEPAHSVVYEHETEGAQRCELRVLQVSEVALTGQAALDWGPSAYEAEVQLITGRTHQIRAQLAAVGSPLLGDLMYGALAVLQSSRCQPQHDTNHARPRGDKAVAQSKAPRRCSASKADAPADNALQSWAPAGAGCSTLGDGKVNHSGRSLVPFIQQASTCGADSGAATDASGVQLRAEIEFASGADTAFRTELHSGTQNAFRTELASWLQPVLGPTPQAEPLPTSERWSAAAQADPLRSIGLQAWCLDLALVGEWEGDLPQVMHAGVPWWRRGEEP